MQQPHDNKSKDSPNVISPQKLEVHGLSPKPGLSSPYTAPRNEIERSLIDIWQQHLGIEQIGIHDNFFLLGGDSLLSIQIVASANQCGLQFTLKQLLQNQTVAELATVVDTSPSIPPEQEVVAGPVPYLGEYWFQRYFHEPNNWSLISLQESEQVLDPAILSKVVQHLLLHHDALRLRLVQEKTGWRQFIAEPGPRVPFDYVDLSALPEQEQTITIQVMATKLQTSLSLAEGPLIRIILFNLGVNQSNCILIVFHHFVSDMYSWIILLEDLQTAYRQLSQGQAIQLLPKTSSIKQWLERLANYLHELELRNELSHWDYWLALPWGKIAPIPVDYPEGRQANIEGSVRIAQASLGIEQTNVLRFQAPQVYKAQIDEIILTALVQGFARWTGAQALLIEQIVVGRASHFPGIDLSRTVAWLSHGITMLLDLRDAPTPEDAVKTIKEQIRDMPFGLTMAEYTRGCDINRIKDEEIRERLKTLPEREVLFNFINAPSPIKNSFLQHRGVDVLPPNLQDDRDRLLYCISSIEEGQLVLSWQYSVNLHQRATIETLASYVLEALRDIINYCQVT